MAYTPLNLGYTPTAGLKYTATVDSSADFGLVPNNTYFFNKGDEEVYYKDNAGTVLVIFGTAYSGGGNSAWKPMDMALDSWLGSGAVTLLSSSTAGFFKAFGAIGDDAVVAEMPLDHEGINYDGSDIQLRITWQLDGLAPSVGDTVRWQINYKYLAVGEDGNPVAPDATIVTLDILVDARTPDTLYVDDLPIMTGGAIGDKVLGITITRIQLGGGINYGADADVFAIEILKV
jgi:hypothetical protein